MMRPRPGWFLVPVAFLFVLCCFVQTGSISAQDAEETPAEAEETPDEAEETPAEAEETPDEAEETPAEAEETPEEAEEPPAEAEEMPDEAEAAPSEAEEMPDEAEVAEAEEMEPSHMHPTDTLGHPEGPHYPPSTGKFVGDHWTPYDPPDPESFPPNSEFHIIEPGDTLWDLAGRYLENPWLWPQLWDVNQYILDSHWIYPGDPLLIVAAPTVIAEAETVPEPEPMPPPPSVEEFPEEPEEVEAPPPLPPPPALFPVAGMSDIYCSNHIVEKFKPLDLYIAEREEGAKSILATGDIVFLSQGADSGMSPGLVYTIIRPEYEVIHPIKGHGRLGTSVRSIGRLQVLAVQESSATAEIVDACDGIELGNYLVPFEEIAVPLAGPSVFRAEGIELTGENTGYIVDVMDRRGPIGTGHIVNIDMGSQDGIQPGDRFTVFRGWSGTVPFSSGITYIEGQQERAARIAKKAEKKGKGVYSHSILGQLVVIGTQETTSTAKITGSAREMYVGDQVELR